MRSIRNMMSILIVAMLASIFSSAVAQASDLVVVRQDAAVSLDSYFDVGVASRQVYDNIFDSLLTIDAEGNLLPRLAVGWERLDARRWQLQLREGVVFHSGTPFTSSAVKFTFDRMFDVTSPGKAAPWMPNFAVDVVDDYTVVIETPEPVASLLYHLAVPWAGIVDPSEVARLGSDFGSQPSGTGPYRLVDWQPGERVTLERNEDFWGGLPAVERVVFRAIPEELSRVLMFLRGDADIIYGVPPESVDQINRTAGTSVHEGLSLRTIYVHLNNNLPPLDDVRVREALNLAIDVEGMAPIWGDAATAARGLMAPGVFGFHEVEYGYDPERALALLADAGWTRDSDGIMRNASGQQMSLVYWTSRDQYPREVEIAGAIQAQLNALGIDVQVDAVPWGTLASRLPDGADKFHMLLAGLGVATADADYGLYPLYHSSNQLPAGGNRSMLADERVDELLEVGQTGAGLDSDVERQQVYRELQERLRELSPVIPVYHLNVLIGVWDHVEGLTVHPGETIRIANVTLRSDN